MPPTRGALDAFAARLGVAADATIDEFNAALDKRLSDERLHGALTSALGLPLDASGDDVIGQIAKRRAANTAAPARAPLSVAPTAARTPEDAEDALINDLAAGRYSTSNGRTPGEWS